MPTKARRRSGMPWSGPPVGVRVATFGSGPRPSPIASLHELATIARICARAPSNCRRPRSVRMRNDQPPSASKRRPASSTSHRRLSLRARTSSQTASSIRWHVLSISADCSSVAGSPSCSSDGTPPPSCGVSWRSRRCVRTSPPRAPGGSIDFQTLGAGRSPPQAPRTHPDLQRRRGDGNPATSRCRSSAEKSGGRTRARITSSTSPKTCRTSQKRERRSALAQTHTRPGVIHPASIKPDNIMLEGSELSRALDGFRKIAKRHVDRARRRTTGTGLALERRRRST